jgi:type IV pilus assembly protein PilC
MTLPVTTRIIIFTVKSIRNPWCDLMAFIFLIFMLNSLKVYYSTVEGRMLIDTFTINMILFGNILRKVLITRFCWTLSGLISGGISVLESLKTSESIITNMYMRSQIQKCRLQIIEGKSLSRAFADVEMLPRMFKDMVMVGEETGHIAEQIKKIGNFYDMEINYAIESFSSIIEPILIMVMGIVIGFVLISLFLPIYQIVQSF